MIIVAACLRGNMSYSTLAKRGTGHYQQEIYPKHVLALLIILMTGIKMNGITMCLSEII